MPMTRSEAGKLGATKALATHAERKSKKIEEYERSPKLCETCDAPLLSEKRHNNYCNHTCAARTSNIGIARNRKPWTPRLCVECKSLCKKGRKYCPECIDKKRHIRYVDEWEKVTNNRAARRLFLLENGHSCAICLYREWNGELIPLEVNHKDGNADNWKKENLELICPNCHALTPTYKSKNRHKGSSRQVNRRARYAAGKTF